MFERLISLRSLVEALPLRALARCHFTTSHRRCSLTSSAKIESSSSTEPTTFPAMFFTSTLAMTSSSGLDLDVHAGREIELHQRVERLLRRLEDVEQALVGADLELLARLLVAVRGAEHAVLVDLGGQRDGAGHARTGAARGVDDLAGRLIEQLVIVGLEADADLGGRHCLTQ